MLRSAYYRLVKRIFIYSANARGIQVPGSVSFLGKPIIRRSPDSTIRIGGFCVLISSSRSTALGVNHAVVLRTLLPGATLSIGNHVGMSGGSICAAYRVEIGDHCLLGANVTIADTDFHHLYSNHRRYEGVPSPSPDDAVRIGRNVFLGAGSIVLKGVVIGDDCIIGAGSVVTRSMPAGSVCVGSPARVVRNWR